MLMQEELLKKATTLAQKAESYSGDDGFLQPRLRSTECTELKDTLDKIWSELGKLQTEINSHQKVQTIKKDENVRCDVYIAKEKAIKGEIQAHKESLPILLPKEPKVQEDIIIEELSRSVKEMNDALFYVGHQRKAKSEELDREKHLLANRQQINDALKDRLDHPEERQPDHVLQEELDKKQEKMQSYLRKVMRQMAAFIRKQFPPPSDEDLAKFARKRKLSGINGEMREVLPLQRVLEELMNKCVDSPNDAYICLDHRYWPPYIALLVQCGIAQRQPDNDQYLRITPFHL